MQMAILPMEAWFEKLQRGVLELLKDSVRAIFCVILNKEFAFALLGQLILVN